MTDSTDNITTDVEPRLIDLTGTYMTAVQLAAHFKRKRLAGALASGSG
jgi:hypothetical protein